MLHMIRVNCSGCRVKVQDVEQHFIRPEGTEVVSVRHRGSEGRCVIANVDGTLVLLAGEVHIHIFTNLSEPEVIKPHTYMLTAFGR